MRIFPPYWIVLTFVVATYALSPQLGVARQHEWPNVVASYVLFPMPDQPVLGVAWTLVFEMAFYVLFAGYIFIGRSLLWIFVPWTIAVLWAAAYGSLDYPIDFLTSPYHLEFAMGVLVAAGVRNTADPGKLPMMALIAAGLAIFAGCALSMGAILGAGSANCGAYGVRHRRSSHHLRCDQARSGPTVCAFRRWRRC